MMDTTILPVVGQAAAVIKVVTWIKLLVENWMGYKIEGKAAYILVVIVSLAWEVIQVLASGGTLSIEALSPSLVTALKAVIGYGVVSLGIFGQPGKDFISKPVL